MAGTVNAGEPLSVIEQSTVSTRRVHLTSTVAQSRYTMDSFTPYRRQSARPFKVKFKSTYSGARK